MVKNKKEVVEAKIITKEEVTKPFFFPRLIAYIIDIILVSIICTGIMFLIPKNDNYDKYVAEYKNIQADYIEGNIKSDEYINKSVDIVYDIDYSNVIATITEAILIILYFVVFQYYNKGQTVGKKLLKLRVVSVDDRNLTINQIAIRALIINSILINILIIAAILFVGRSYYYYVSSALQFISVILVFVTLVMILFRKDGRGLHDMLAKTKVIQKN